MIIQSQMDQRLVQRQMGLEEETVNMKYKKTK